jgi:membrane-associated phospholipid phosphatase
MDRTLASPRRLIMGTEQPSIRRRLARLLTEVFAPAPTVATLLFVIAWHSAPTPLEALKWAFLAILFSSLVPIAYILLGVRRRRLTDHHVRLREQRKQPLLVAIASVLVGLTLLIVGGAPRDLIALVGAGACGLAVAIAFTLFWTLSIHVAVVAGTVAVLTIVFGPGFLWLLPLVALVAWSRVALGDHTPAQVVVGAVVGAAVATAAFSLLR